jgi:hypothetical protein
MTCTKFHQILNRTIALLVSMTAVLAFATVLLAQTNSVSERFTFMAANVSKANTTDTGRHDIVVNRWSTDADRDRLFSVVRDSGPNNLLDALRDAPTVGYMHWPGHLNYGLRYARRTPRPDGGEDVVLVADRPIWLWWGTATSTASTDSPFTVIQLQLNKQGAGEGKFSVANKISSNKEVGIVLEDYANQPVLLNDVQREKTSLSTRAG